MSLFLALLAAGAALSVVWILLSHLVVESSHRVRTLSEVLAHEGDGGAPGLEPPLAALPSLTVVVTARDEAAGIESTVRRLHAQRYPELRIVVVDDRSTDGTSVILDRLVAETPPPEVARGRLMVIHNQALPEGWLGKCHACHLGAAAAGSDWLLFTDGDVIMQDDGLLAAVVRHAERRRLDHVAVIPDLGPMPAVQGGLVSVFGQTYLLATRAWEMERDLPRGGGGIGAFNLVRRAAYERIGGHVSLKLDPGDDFKLGVLLKESGARQRIYNGIGLVFCPWQRGALNVVRGLEKNFFAGCDYSLARTAALCAAGLLITFGPLLVGLFGTTPGARAFGPAGLAAAWVPFAMQAGLVLRGYATEAWRYGLPAWTLGLLYPLSVTLLVAAAVNSAVRVTLRGGVLWRDTFYPLAALRAGLVVPAGAGDVTCRCCLPSP